MNSCQQQGKGTFGFTLLEVVIAVAILAILSFYTAQSIQKAGQTKAKVQVDIERISGVRDALRILERDINAAFNYRDINIELYNRSGKEREIRAKTKKDEGKTGTTPTEEPKPEPVDPTTGGTPAEGAQPFKPKPVVIITQFLGQADSLHFTARSNSRTQVDEQASDQMEVGYYLDTCRSRATPEQSSKCLYRRTSIVIDKAVDKGGDAIPILENVQRFELRYLPLEPKAEWTKSWASGEGGDSRTKGNFPLAVEITLETQDKNVKPSKPTLMTTVAEVRNPNNPSANATEKEAANATDSPQPQNETSKDTTAPK